MFVAIPSPNFINSLKQRDFPTNMFRTISRDQRSPSRSVAISRVSSRFRVVFSNSPCCLRLTGLSRPHGCIELLCATTNSCTVIGFLKLFDLSASSR